MSPLGAHGMGKEMAEKRDWYPQNRSSYPLDYSDLPLLRSPFGGP